ncbi:hypothetical protein K469DRAFT_708204 [Zopfia rhizophila CBS 207.26]|uniref:Uncharacterized protein n=1 Tax=Zopfia rhizophila CBS 207.26 TaxID=1314779 RepID=A0A6A6E464_9PEZI|nr:hypothetical protein K469DRAFT_708204 [Zopfia rhizophila CBS 207.26]
MSMPIWARVRRSIMIQPMLIAPNMKVRLLMLIVVLDGADSVIRKDKYEASYRTEGDTVDTNGLATVVILYNAAPPCRIAMPSSRS